MNLIISKHLLQPNLILTRIKIIWVKKDSFEQLEKLKQKIPLKTESDHEFVLTNNRIEGDL
jgi:hypothetical protein